MNNPTTGQPRPNVLDPRFKYTNAMNTDIRKTWEKYGWKPVHPQPPKVRMPGLTGESK